MAEWIVEIGDGNPHIKKMIPLVRCKDCKHNTKLFNDQGRAQFGDGVCPCKRAGADPYIDWDPDPDWFCADGERMIE